MNELYRIEINDLAFGGEGVGRIENMVCFVPFTAPGDIVQVEITQHKKKFLRGRVVAFDTPSPKRVEAPCPYFGECGGCQWQHIDYSQQLGSKRAHLQHVLHKSAKIDYPVPAAIASPKTYNYRRTAQLKVNASGELGFFREHSNTVVPIDQCLVMEPALNAVIPRIKEKLAGLQEKESAQLPVEVEIISEDGQSASFHFIYKGRHSTQSFLQANREVNTHLQEFILRHVRPHVQADRTGRTGQTVLDLFCGDGNLSLPLANLGVQVIGYDISRPAIKKARRAAEQIDASGPENQAKPGAGVEAETGTASSYSFRKAPFQEIIRTITELASQTQVAIFDPPRQGLDGKAESMAALGIPLILYVSCNPGILARDLVSFIHAGYEITELQPMDMFPHTYHLETAVALKLAGSHKKKGE
ncbi:MAG: class I SAM-dependent RNA methyltransferase [Spirochaetia bacterium]|nr:class I SAM-dependent RNA methyltransferase [Spirochaetia bacterium]